MTVLLNLEPRIAESTAVEPDVEFAEKWDDDKQDSARCLATIPKVTLNWGC